MAFNTPSWLQWIPNLVVALLTMIQQFWYLTVMDYVQDGEGGYRPKTAAERKEESPIVELVYETAEYDEDSSNSFFWILNPGSGDDDPKGVSPLFEDGETKFFEGEFTRTVLQKVAVMLAAEGVSYNFLTNSKRDVSNTERIDSANLLGAGCNNIQPIMLTLHSNSTGKGDNWRNPNGVEAVYFAGAKHGRRFATIFQEYLIENLEWRDRGLRTANYGILRDVDMPSVLLRVGFFDNKSQVQLLADDEVQNVIARSIVDAIHDINRLGEYEGF